MRISTSQIYKQAIQNILSQQSKVNQTTAQIASGKQVSKPSEDPVGATKAHALKQEISNVENYLNNVKVVRNRLSLEELHLSEVGNILQRVRELHLQASNDTLNQSNRESIKVEMQQKLEEILAIANMKDAQGNYVYSGFQSSKEPFQLTGSGNYQYSGDEGTRRLQVAESISVQVSESGRDIFSSYKKGNGSFYIEDSGTTNQGSAVISNNSADKLNLISDTYTVTFVTNSDGDIAYQVNSATTGQVIPAPPATAPDDAPNYTPGETISFNGHNLEINGAPELGDSFTIKPSDEQNILNSIQALIVGLEKPSEFEHQRAHLKSLANQGLQEIDQALDEILNLQTTIGARMRTVDTAENLNSELIINNKATISSIEDLDITEAIIKLNADSIALEAAQQSFAKIQNLSIFNYI